jgi:hypothetical protein
MKSALLTLEKLLQAGDRLRDAAQQVLSARPRQLSDCAVELERAIAEWNRAIHLAAEAGRPILRPGQEEPGRR